MIAIQHSSEGGDRNIGGGKDAAGHNLPEYFLATALAVPAAIPSARLVACLTHGVPLFESLHQVPLPNFAVARRAVHERSQSHRRDGALNSAPIPGN